MALQGLGDLTGVDLAEAKLDSGVAVDLFGANLGDDVGADLHDSQGHEVAVGIPHLGHAELAAEQRLDGAPACCFLLVIADVLRA